MTRCSGVAEVVLACVLAGGCDAERLNPIRVEGRAIVIENRSETAWTNVEVWVNDHYRVTTPTVSPGGRFMAPLDTFVAGFGQRFPGGESVYGVEVLARTPDGTPVTLRWGKGRRR